MIDAAGRAALDALRARPAIAQVFAALDGEGEEIRIVGGAVRNALLGHPVHEVDFASTATPDVTTARAEQAGLKVVPTGLEHGTVTVIVAGETFEVTSLREDVETFGRRARVRFGRSFAADAVRRDFTINALALDRDGRVHDHTEGLADLAARRVRFIGDADRRIREDYLRILRFFRFHAAYAEGPIDQDGLSAAVAERSGLALLSRERIRVEVLKLLVAPRAVETVETVSQAGLLLLILGGVVDLGRLARVRAFEEGAGPDGVRRLTALAVLVPEDAERLRERLRLSNGEGDRLAAYATAVAALRSPSDPIDPRRVRVLAAEHGVEALTDAAAALAGEPRPVWTGEGERLLRRFASGAEALPTLPLRGADLIAQGVPKGPHVGHLMAEARRIWLRAGCPTGPETRAWLLRHVLAEADA